MKQCFVFSQHSRTRSKGQLIAVRCRRTGLSLAQEPTSVKSSAGYNCSCARRVALRPLPDDGARVGCGSELRLFAAVSHLRQLLARSAWCRRRPVSSRLVAQRQNRLTTLITVEPTDLASAHGARLPGVSCASPICPPLHPASGDEIKNARSPSTQIAVQVRCWASSSSTGDGKSEALSPYLPFCSGCR